jgi:hypothetical protein
VSFATWPLSDAGSTIANRTPVWARRSLARPPKRSGLSFGGREAFALTNGLLRCYLARYLWRIFVLESED